MSRKDRKRVNPIEESRKWSEKNINPPGFNRSLFENKGRGVRTIVRRNAGDFLLVYTGKVITTKEGENLEEGFSSGYRFCLQRFVIINFLKIYSEKRLDKSVYYINVEKTLEIKNGRTFCKQ
nr:uncharacterized protein LOC117685941 [Crassostrea gigas]XP_034316451.1 uncharacterized protein LOC117685941 [Crassostrea gigas]